MSLPGLFYSSSTVVLGSTSFAQEGLSAQKPWKFLEHYHQRSNVETAYSVIKEKFGSALRSKSNTGQINEALCTVKGSEGHSPYLTPVLACLRAVGDALPASRTPVSDAQAFANRDDEAVEPG